MAKPFIKWAGGKAYLAQEILKRFPRKVRRYFEPMVGGGAIFFAAEEAGIFKSARISDMNKDLIDTYQIVRDDADSLIEHLDRLERKHINAKSPEGYYYHIRDEINISSLKKVQRAARFIFLNKTCFNGLYRVNRRGKFNVPYGYSEGRKIKDEKVIQEASEALQDVEITVQDFESAAEIASSRDLVYFDPPYWKVNSGAFTAYTGNDFTPDDQKRLAHLCAKLNAKGTRIIASNSDVPQVRALYVGFKLDVVSVPRRINKDGTKRGMVAELIITGRKK